jgi:hypothetical protein
VGYDRGGAQAERPNRSSSRTSIVAKRTLRMESAT